MQDYFVCDGDVVWDGDYEDFIHINRDGQRVLDHSKIDSLKAFKVSCYFNRFIDIINGSLFSILRLIFV